LEAIFGERYIPFKDKLNFKWPGGGAFAPHQDYPAYANFVPRYHVTAMLSIDAATEENGYLHFAERSQESALGAEECHAIQMCDEHMILPYTTGGTSNGKIKEGFTSKFHWIPLETGPRDLVLFDSYLPHYSKENRSKHPRRAMFITYNRESEGEHKLAYYSLKRDEPHNKMFHFATPTQ
jgi:ectoine hydroxylase-related dioxygenase (phytanoyl-CoA dioxygenase family)